MQNLEKSLEKQSWWQLTSIQIGGAICMPVLMVGQQIAMYHGLSAAFFAIALGNLFLFLIGIPYIHLAYEKKISTMQNAIACFGKAGTWVVGISMLVALIGWFAIQLQLVALSSSHLLNICFGSHGLNSISLIILWGAIMTIMALYGLRGINLLADLSMPLLILTIGYASLKASYMPIRAPSTEIGLLKGMTLVIASTLLVVIDIPTYYRHSKSKKDGLLSLFLLYCFATPLIQIVGAYIAMHSHGTGVMDMFSEQGGLWWQIWVSSFLILAGWTTNNTNIYSAAVTLESFFPKLNHKFRTLIIGILGTIAACFPMIAHYEHALSGMTILVGSMGAVVMVSFLFNRYFGEHSYKLPALVAWIMGSLVGLINFVGYFKITSSALLDTFGVATIASFIGFLIVELMKESK